MNEGLTRFRQQALQRWRAFAPRERRWLIAALVVVAMFLVWSLFVQAAWRTLNEAPVQLDRLESELQRMQRLGAEARELRSAAPVSTAAAGMALQSATSRLGSSGKISLQGERATLILTGASPEALRSWLTEARSAARARPLEAQLVRAPAGYSGTVIVSLGTAP